MTAVELCFESTPQGVSLAGAAIRAMCEVAGARSDIAGEIELALVEAANNVVEHAYGGRCGSPVRVRIAFLDDAAEIEVTDRGVALDPIRLANAAIPDFDPDELAELPEGGFGLALVRALSDSVEVESIDGSNCLRFSRRFQPRPMMS